MEVYFSTMNQPLILEHLHHPHSLSISQESFRSLASSDHPFTPAPPTTDIFIQINLSFLLINRNMSGGLKHSRNNSKASSILSFNARASPFCHFPSPFPASGSCSLHWRSFRPTQFLTTKLRVFGVVSLQKRKLRCSLEITPLFWHVLF